MKLFAREADKICRDCRIYHVCFFTGKQWKKRRKVMKKAGYCLSYNAVERVEQVIKGEEK
jgi:hypothetical protein